MNNDIALIRLDKPLELNYYIEPVHLVLQTEIDQDWTGELATTSGWGKTGDYASGSNDLRYIEMRIETQKVCEKSFGVNVAYAGSICANTAYGRRSTCHGDSGGPLVHKSGRLIGVTSFVSSLGCQSGYPAGFTNVGYFLDWIKRHSGV